MTRFLGAERLGRGNHIKNKTEIVSLLRSQERPLGTGTMPVPFTPVSSRSQINSWKAATASEFLKQVPTRLNLICRNLNIDQVSTIKDEVSAWLMCLKAESLLRILLQG